MTSKNATSVGFALLAGESVPDAVRRIAREQIDAALTRIDRARPDNPRTVHEFRKSCKRLRALLRLVRGELEGSGTYHRENAVLRDVARPFSGLRDADVALATYDMLMTHAGPRTDRRAFGQIRTRLTRRRAALLAHLDFDLATELKSARLQLLALRARIESWPLARDGFQAVAPGLAKTYRRAWRRREDALASLDIDAMHEWRKRTKYHRLHLRLIRVVWPAVLEAKYAETDRFSDLLGDERDMRMLRDLVARDRAFRGIKGRRRFVRFVDRRLAAVRRHAFAMGLRIFSETPDGLLGNMAAWWESYEAEQAPARQARSAKPGVGGGVTASGFGKRARGRRKTDDPLPVTAPPPIDLSAPPRHGTAKGGPAKDAPVSAYDIMRALGGLIHGDAQLAVHYSQEQLAQLRPA